MTGEPPDQREPGNEQEPGEPGVPGEGSAEPEPVVEHDDGGLDLARDIARATAARSGVPVRRSGRRTAAPGGRRTPRGRISGAHPDERDPQTLESSLDRLVGDHGWELDLKVHAVFGRWAELVGGDIAAHSTPESFADGRLVVRTDSTAWATQLKYLAPSVLKALNTELGHGTVLHLQVLGPHGPTWKKGRLSARDGRGPRDTYG